MILYCQKCNNITDKTDNETYPEGEKTTRKCARCGTISFYYICYKAFFDKEADKLTNSGN